MKVVRRAWSRCCIVTRSSGPCEVHSAERAAGLPMSHARSGGPCHGERAAIGGGETRSLRGTRGQSYRLKPVARWTVCAVAVALAVPAARADDPRWTFEVLGTTLGDVTNRHVVMGGATVGLGYQFIDHFSVMVDASGYGFSEGRVDGVATGMTVGLRQHLGDVGRLGFDVDVSGGILGANRELPYNGTHFNETIEFGPAVTYRLRDDLALVGGVRYFHLSNADRQNEPGRNPSINAIQGVLGLEWRF